MGSPLQGGNPAPLVRPSVRTGAPFPAGEGFGPAQIGRNSALCETFGYIYWELGRSAPVGGAGGPVCRPYGRNVVSPGGAPSRRALQKGVAGTCPLIRPLRGHLSLSPLSLRDIIPTPFGLRPFPPDRGNRPLDKGSWPPVGGRLLGRSNREGFVLLWDVWIHILEIGAECACWKAGGSGARPYGSHPRAAGACPRPTVFQK